MALFQIKLSHDGKTIGYVTVQLLDANGNSVGGKTVKLSPKFSAVAQVTPTSGVSSTSNGSVTFQVTDEKLEDVTLTATDQTDGVTLATPQAIDFIVIPAAGASLIAGPSHRASRCR